jgi:hypothetical protein
LKRVVLNKSHLNWMQFALSGETFYGRDLIAIVHDGKSQAGIDSTAVYVNRASATLAVIAPFLSSRQSKPVPKGIEERSARINVNLLNRSIHAQFHG